MEILVKRNKSYLGATIGKLYINGSFECYTLEDEVREVEGKHVSEWKIHGKTAIPKGHYRVTIDFSPRFKKLLPHILDVPGFSGIRIHAGNTAENTEGCLLVGDRVTKNSIVGGTSRPALIRLQGKIQRALSNNQEVYITIG